MNLRIPGPTPCPKEVLEAMTRQMVNHRGIEFRDLLLSTTERAKKIFQTENDLFILTSSGTGGLEAAISNFFSRGDKVISATVGYFGDRFAKIAENYGANVVRIPKNLGSDVDPSEFERFLRKNRDTKGVLITHNETSTGVVNKLNILSDIARRYNVLVVVDAVSSMSSVPIPTDAWGLDVVVSASQKGWMTPPGLSMVSVSPKAWWFNGGADMPRCYFDLAVARHHFAKSQTFATPAVSLFFALDCALDMILNEGLDNVFFRHEKMAARFRQKALSADLEFFAQPHCRSNTITALKVPNRINGKEIIKDLKEKFEIEVSGGIEELDGKILRIAHMGAFNEKELDDVVEALKLIADGKHD